MIELIACPSPITIQDLGRHGYRHLGVPLSGALDSFSLRLANALVGNPPEAAGIELRLLGPTIRVDEPTCIALAHASAVVIREDERTESLPPWRSVWLAPGDTLRVGLVTGGVGYLTVSGGIAEDPVLGSRSTYLRAGIGRRLHAGDRLPVGPSTASAITHAVSPAPTFEHDAPIRVLPGPQLEHFTVGALEALISSPYTVTPAADRMGLRLAGPRLEHSARGADIVSDAVTPGAIQVPSDGQPIVLLTDCQTVGGYAKIATVISADLPRLGRLLPGANMRFAVVDLATAVAARQTAEAELATLIARIQPVGDGPQDGIDLAALYSANLVDGVIDASHRLPGDLP
jgi:biotin-dependent carboxylase-like uncharacterized protein